MEIFNKLFQKAKSAYQKADKASGGWLPGGGTASPVTKAVFPAQPFPGRTKELERQTGVKTRITSLHNNSISDKIPYLTNSQAYANPYLNEVKMRNYQGGKTPRERYVEHHELGHIYGGDNGWTRLLGASGRSLKDFSSKLGNLAPLDVVAGLKMQHLDAPEEDRAERFAAKWAKTGNYPAPAIYEDRTSDYGNTLRRQGKELSSSGIERITNPYGIRTKVVTFINTHRAKPLQEELTRSLPAYREASSKTDEITPELITESKRLSDLAKQIEALGLEPQY